MTFKNGNDLIGLDSLTPLPQVHASYKETLLIVHPDKDNGVVVDGESQASQNFKEAFKVSKNAHDAEAGNSRLINQRPRAAALLASAAAPGPAAAPCSAPQPQSLSPAQGTSAASDNNILSHCIIAEDNNRDSKDLQFCTHLMNISIDSSFVLCSHTFYFQGIMCWPGPLPKLLMVFFSSKKAPKQIN